MNCQRPLFFMIVTALCLMPLSAFATADMSRFQEANAAYSAHKYTTAIGIYENLLVENGYSPGVLYNLANSYAQAGKIGKAVLNYERALKLSPSDSDILGNLQLVRTATGLFTREPTVIEHILDLLSMNQWTTLAGLGAAALVCTLLLSFRLKLSTRTVTLLSLACLAAMAVGVINTIALRQEWGSSVVITESRLQISPFAGATAAGNIQEGRLVYPKNAHGDYFFVEDETGRKGWILQSAVEPVIPAEKD